MVSLISCRQGMRSSLPGAGVRLSESDLGDVPVSDVLCFRARDDLNNLHIVALGPENKKYYVRPPRVIYKWPSFVSGIILSFVFGKA